MIKETLPSWFLSIHGLGQEGGESRGKVAMVGGYALAYIAVLCGTFAWGMDSSSPASRRRPKILGAHLEFLASAPDGKISLGWLRTNVDVLKRLSKGLFKAVERGRISFGLLGIGGLGAITTKNWAYSSICYSGIYKRHYCIFTIGHPYSSISKHHYRPIY